MIMAPPCRSPLASLMATMFGCGAIARTVSHSIGTTERGGMSYNTFGSAVASATGAEVCDQTRLRRARVVGRDDQKTVCALGLAGLRQMHAMSRVVGAGPGDDPRSIANGFEDGAEQGELLVVRRRR